ncbi:efflux RND transporter permease subunit [Thalassotalea sp. ND16A]|uniref:efflux RND transporter permease subunit n=1 Tax=Thalassotalea sp. ND16A TaxID=1535422 RepID=UPI00051A3A40|nr:CusA/CzcA family heavy metal efflux RND transporter [Thalassotalea sp. ND16A]
MFALLIKKAVDNRMLVIFAVLALMLIAALNLQKLNLDAFPDVTNIQVSINTEAPGLGAEEVEQLITFPVESVMYALPNVSEVRSVSKTGLSLVTVVFNDDVDIYFARQLVFERLSDAKEMLPDGIGVPEMGPNTSGLGQVYQYILETDEHSDIDLIQLRSLNDWVVKLLLMPIDGVTDVLSFGGEVKQYQVNVNPSKLRAFHLSLDDVYSAIAANNNNVGGWYLDRGQEQVVIRAVGWIEPGEKGLTSIEAIPLKTIDSKVVRVSDIAEVGFGGEIRQGAVSYSSKDESGKVKTHGEVVAGVVLKRMGANTKATIDGITERTALIKQALPEGVTFTPFYDQATLIEQAVKTVVDALSLAFVFILVILALFLLNLRATFLVLISIPLSIGLALMVMNHYQLSANLMSLGGLTVAIGMLVDGSVVIVESILSKLEQQQQQNKLAGTDEKLAIAQLIKTASSSVAKPIFFASMIILVVFAPLYSLEGVEAKLFKPMAISIMLAIVSALAVALIVVPAFATYLFKGELKLKTNPVLAGLEQSYQRLLNFSFSKPKMIIVMAVALLVSALTLLPKLGTEFVPELEEGTINLRVTLAPSASLNTALDVAPKLEQMLMEFNQVTDALSRVGRPELGGDPEPVSNLEIYLGLKPITQWQGAQTRAELQQQMLTKLEQFPGLLFTFSQPIATRVDELLSGVKAQLAIKLFGNDLSLLASKGEEINQLVSQIEGTTGVSLEQITGEAQLVVRPNRLQLSRYGLAIDDVMKLVEKGIGGGSAGQIINGNERYDIYVRLNEDKRNNIDAIENLRLQNQQGIIVRLGDVASISYESGPPQIRRDNVQRRVVVQANVSGRDMGSVVAEINTAIKDNIELPAGFSVEIGGQYENQQRAQKRLAIVVPISIVLIGLLLFLAFNSFSQALLILINVPLALIGGIYALYLTGQYLSVPSSIGFITLFGVAVLNGVVMVESINQRIANTVHLSDAIKLGAISRLRPVLMTALTSALGLIPMLLATGVGSEIQRPLATVIVGGLLSATLLTLVVLPSLYLLFSKTKIKQLTA